MSHFREDPEKKKKGIILSEELDKILEEKKVYIEPIGIYQLSNWIDWLLMKTQRKITKQNILDAIATFEKNWGMLK